MKWSFIIPWIRENRKYVKNWWLHLRQWKIIKKVQLIIIVSEILYSLPSWEEKIEKRKSEKREKYRRRVTILSFTLQTSSYTPKNFLSLSPILNPILNNTYLSWIVNWTVYSEGLHTILSFSLHTSFIPLTQFRVSSFFLLPCYNRMCPWNFFLDYWPLTTIHTSYCVHINFDTKTRLQMNEKYKHRL